MRREAGTLQETTCSRHHAADNIQRESSSRQRASTPCSGQCAAGDKQRITCSEQRAADNVLQEPCQRTTCSGHDEWDDTQQTRCSGRWACSRNIALTGDIQPTTMHTTTRSSKHTRLRSVSGGAADGGRMHEKGCTPRGPHLIRPLGCCRRLPLSHTIPLCQRFHARVWARACARKKTTFCSRHLLETTIGRQHATDHMQLRTCSRQRATDKMQRETLRRQHATDNSETDNMPQTNTGLTEVVYVGIYRYQHTHLYRLIYVCSI
jgi:hypothetical protein